MAGRLSLIGTPIGNLGDITIRAVEQLKAVARIYAEDTRRTRVLLSHLGIEGKRLLSLHAHSGDRMIASAVESLAAGEDVALVTDAGMPGVSDPGAELVRAAREAGIVVDVIPGPSAVTTAVALSGLVDGPFTFLGFLARKGAKRKETLKRIQQSPFPVVLFESPHRVNDTLSDLLQVCEPERQVAICRELTKKFEETLVLPLSEVAAPGYREQWQGEFTLVVDRSRGREVRESDDEFDLSAHAATLLASGTSVKGTTALIQKELVRRGEKSNRRDIYNQVLALSDGRHDAEGPPEGGASPRPTD